MNDAVYNQLEPIQDLEESSYVYNLKNPSFEEQREIDQDESDTSIQGDITLKDKTKDKHQATHNNFGGERSEQNEAIHPPSEEERRKEHQYNSSKDGSVGDTATLNRPYNLRKKPKQTSFL